MRKVFFVLALLVPLVAKSQIYTQGTDPGYLKWYSIESPGYKVIYPEGADSLARRYAVALERFRIAHGRSIGMTPGALQWGKTPVVLHTHYGYSNGSMFWAPKRMDLFTRMDPYGADPSPWDIQLAAHEPRHQAQLQAGYRGIWKPLGYLFGELIPAAVWALYPSQALSEGDAVAVETALSAGSRARTADFLNYFRVAFDEGDMRNWYRWRYGSYKHFTPDYYKVGYMTVAGVRYFYDRPLFMKEYFDHIIAHPFSIGNMQKITRNASGRSFKATFSDIMDGFHTIWQAESQARGPFMPKEQITCPGTFPADYASPVLANGAIYVLKEGYACSKSLVRIQEGKETVIRPFAGDASSLYYDGPRRRIYWSETVGDARWDLAHTSRIRYLNLADGRVVTLTREGRLYNPQPSGDGRVLATVEYPYRGGGAVSVVSTYDGTILRRIPAPDGLQPSECAWYGSDLYVSGITEGGYGIYKIGPEGDWETVFAPAVTKVVNLRSGERSVEWVADRDGENELYRYYPEEGKLLQWTANRYGATDFCEDGEWLYFSSQTSGGMMLFRTALKDLVPKEVAYADVHAYPVEDALSAQERALAGDAPFTNLSEPQLTAPERYRKWTNLLHFHSWAPLYFNYDAVSSMSLDRSYDTVSPGVTGLFQNDLGTFSGYVGYGIHRDPDIPSHWRNSFHGKFTYTGLYPVIEASFDMGDNNARQYILRHHYQNNRLYGMGTAGARTSRPQMGGTLSLYIPLRFNSGGALCGFIPRLNYGISSSAYDTGALRFDRSQNPSGIPSFQIFRGQESGENHFMQSLSGSLRGYRMLPVADSQVYPRLGVGAEAGFRFRPGLTRVYTPNVYGYLYGYLPGFGHTQGFRLTGTFQHQFRGKGLIYGEMAANMVPRGFPVSAASTIAMQAADQWKLTAEYALPIFVGDISTFSPVAYIKNFLLVPQVDYTGFREGNLVSVGADITAELANLLWFPFDCSVGVSIHWLTGSWYDHVTTRPLSVEMVFSMDI